MSTNNSRPLSADDIQKAKMRAMFMQEKYGKVDASKVTDKPEIMEIKKPPGLVNSNVRPMPRSPLTPTPKQPVDPGPLTSKQGTVPSPDQTEIPTSPKLKITSRENSIEKLDSKRVHWQIPPEVWVDPSWSLGAGDNSKEVEVQTQRNRREKETFYANMKDIPLNPKDPWDVEMDFDDSLTPEIPIDQPPDADPMVVDSVGPVPPNIGVSVEDKQVGSTSSASPAVVACANGAASEPDLELLAVLLKNPQLVFALSSNQGGTLPNEQTVALLDMLKQTGLGLSELVNGLTNGAGVPNEPEPGPETIPTSLPSPTPPKDRPASASWRSEFQTQVRAPNLQQAHLSNRGNTPLVANAVQQSFSNVVSSLPSQPYTSVSALPTHIQPNVPSLPQLAVSVNSPTQHVASVNNLLNRAPVHQHAQSYALMSDPAAVAIHQQPAVNKSAYELQNIPNPALAHSVTPEPNTSYTTLSWQSSAANVPITGRNTIPDPWAARTTNSFNVASSNSMPYLSQSAYGNQSTQSTYNAYGSASVSSQVLDRNGYAHTVECQMSGRDAHHRLSRSPEVGAGRVYGGTQGCVPEPPRQRNYVQQSYNPEPSRPYVSGQKSYPPAEPSRPYASGQKSYPPPEPSLQWSSGQQSYASVGPRQWSSGQQSYVPSDSSRQWGSGQQSYTSAEPLKPRNSVYQDQYTETSRQWSFGKQQDHYNPSDGRSSYDQQHWRRR